MILDEYDVKIIRINFYSGKQTLAKVGMSDDVVKKSGDRVEKFEIAEDERLIGCELEHDADSFRGITWLKIKMIKWS